MVALGLASRMAWAGAGCAGWPWRQPPGWLGGLRYAGSHAGGWTASRNAAL